ncbi:MAG TPA: permease [Tissierellaceae bacterium]|nr:permease [Tissierellaceae bacterium]
MTQTTIILSLVAIILIFINSRKTGKQVEGLKSGMKQMLQTLPLILGAFILAGMIEVLIPAEFVQQWLSKEAGPKGIILGTFGGMILAMGPYAAFPIIASIMASGAGLGTVVSLITGWALLGLSKAPFEAAFFGAKFFTYKMVFSIPFCIIAGFLAHLIEMVIV